MNALLVGNPTAQSGKAEGRIERALAAMRARGWSVELMRTLPAGATVQALREHLDAHPDVEAVVCLGGDGTFAEVAKGVLAAAERRPMGMLPSGTANDQGKSFGVSSREGDLQRNLDVIQAGHRSWLDIGRVGRIGPDGRVDVLETFFHSVGWGMQPDILAQRNRDRESVNAIPLLREIYRDELVYAGAALEKLLESYVEPAKFDAWATVDGLRLHLQKLTDLVLNATPVYGGRWVLDRRSRPDDGLFELVPIKGRREWASKAILDLRGSPLREEDLRPLGVEHSESFQGAEFDVELLHSADEGKPVSTQIDGEEWVAGTRFRVSVLPRQLPLLTPADFQPPWT